MHIHRIISAAAPLPLAAVMLLFGISVGALHAGTGDPVPYPFSDKARISFELPTAQFVTLTVVDMDGNEVATALKSTLPAGRHVVEFDGIGLKPGAYIILLVYGETTIRRIIVVREEGRAEEAGRAEGEGRRAEGE